MDNFMEQIEHAANNVSDEWGISGFGEHETASGAAYRGVISRCGDKAADFFNRGDGGATLIHFTDPAARVDFEAEARRLFPTSVEAPDHLVLALLERFAA